MTQKKMNKILIPFAILLLLTGDFLGFIYENELNSIMGMMCFGLLYTTFVLYTIAGGIMFLIQAYHKLPKE